MIEKQSENEISVDVLPIRGIILQLAIISSGCSPPGGGEVKHKEVNIIDFSAPSLHLRLVGKCLSPQAVTVVNMLAATIPKTSMKTQLERNMEFMVINVGNRTSETVSLIQL